MRALREARAVTQAGFAAQLGVGLRTLQRWEQGTTPPDALGERALLAYCETNSLFRHYSEGVLAGNTLTRVWLCDLLAEARLSAILRPSAADVPASGLAGADAAGGVALPAADAAASAAPKPAATVPSLSAERRQVTVLVCELVDAAQLAVQLDPEELRAMLQACESAYAPIIRRFGGYLAEQHGGQLLVYFGFPLAHEDDARRAVHTALGIIQAIARLNAVPQRLQSPHLGVRLGIHTGQVVSEQMPDYDQRTRDMLVGGAPTVAGFLQREADPNTVLISSITYQLVQGYFACRRLANRALPGDLEPLVVYQVLHATQARGRLEADGATTLTPLVGREHELHLIWERWGWAKEGNGQVVLLSGEPGIGKSRLVHALKQRMAGEAPVLLECHGSPYYQNSALYPIADGLEHLLGIRLEDSSEEKLARLASFLRRYGLSEREAVPLFASLLSLPLVEPYVPLNLTPESLRQRTLKSVTGLLLAMAVQQPLVFVIEDLHWTDATTQELLSLFIDQAPTTHTLAIFTHRLEFTSPWPARAHILQLTLNRLRQEQAETVVRRVSGRKSLSDTAVRQIANRADGVPLFLEELTKAVLESDVIEERGNRYEPRGLLFALSIPATLQASLLARLDRLQEAKDLAQLGAVLGREFDYGLLQATSGRDDETLQRQLEQLVRAELLYQRGLPPHSTYLFKHALVQEAAYESLLRSQQQKYHREIAQVLATRSPQLPELAPELLAHHLTEAGRVEQAITYWQKAGRRAIERSAGPEAISHLTKGIELLRMLPETPERLQQELDLQTALGIVLTPVRGYGSPEVEAAYKRALALCGQVGDTARLFSVVRGLWELYDLRADVPAARQHAETLLRLATENGDAGLLAISHQVLGETVIWSGEFMQARKHSEQAITLHDPHQHQALAFLHGGYDAGVVSRSWAAHALWYLGYSDHALRRCEEAVELAERLSQPHTLVFALSHAAVVHHFRQEPEMALMRSDAAIRLCKDQGFEFWEAFATILRGWALAGRGADAVAEIRRGMAGYQASGAELERPLWLAFLAGAHQRAGQYDEALLAIADGLAASNMHGTSFYDAELLRLKGEVLLQGPRSDEQRAEACLRAALTISQQQQAKSLELRAAMSLHRLRRRQGRPHVGRHRLERLLSWFTEGLETQDFREAKETLYAGATDSSL